MISCSIQEKGYNVMSLVKKIEYEETNNMRRLIRLCFLHWWRKVIFMSFHMLLIMKIFWASNLLCGARAVKRAGPSGFGLALAGFGLNGPSQKSPGLNGLGKLRT